MALANLNGRLVVAFHGEALVDRLARIGEIEQTFHGRPRADC
jgi:hypothetical protein